MRIKTRGNNPILTLKLNNFLHILPILSQTLLQTFRQHQIYQNLIRVSGYLDFYYQFNKELDTTLTTNHPHPYLPLNNLFKANEYRSFGPIFLPYIFKCCVYQPNCHIPTICSTLIIAVGTIIRNVEKLNVV